MKFIADGMLGKLTRWLRMLGHDVKYSNAMEDSELIKTAKKTRRILLTKDLELYQQATAKGVDAFYLSGQTEEDRLAEMAKRFDIELEINMRTSRCPKCNARVKPIPKPEAEKKVEKNTLTHYDSFWKCSKCGQIYWQGAHWTRIQRTLEKAKEKLKGL
ncbi:MAG TPA: Mut7-C RNAse domain-containing protein [Candidatus Bathyarchaeia archaeon]